MMLSRILLQTLPKRTFHCSSRTLLATQTKGRAPPASRTPIEHTHLDQNPHLKHATTSKEGDEGRDKGKGNAAPNPELPSQVLTKKQSKSSKIDRERRGFHSSSVSRGEGGKEKASAEDYFKEVDTTPPDSTKTYRVDGQSDAAHRPNEQYANPEKEYATVSRDEPYEPAVEENGSGTGRENPEQKAQKLRYGGMDRDVTKNV